MTLADSTDGWVNGEPSELVSAESCGGGLGSPTIMLAASSSPARVRPKSAQSAEGGSASAWEWHSRFDLQTSETFRDGARRWLREQGGMQMQRSCFPQQWFHVNGDWWQK